MVNSFKIIFQMLMSFFTGNLLAILPIFVSTKRNCTAGNSGFRLGFINFFACTLPMKNKMQIAMPGIHNPMIVKNHTVAGSLTDISARNLFEFLITQLFQFVVDFFYVFFACCHIISLKLVFYCLYVSKSDFVTSLAEKFSFGNEKPSDMPPKGFFCRFATVTRLKTAAPLSIIITCDCFFAETLLS